jgi:hypothetical protein
VGLAWVPDPASSITPAFNAGQNPAGEVPAAYGEVFGTFQQANFTAPDGVNAIRQTQASTGGSQVSFFIEFDFTK